MIRTIMASAITLTMMSPGFAAEPAKAQRMFFGIKGGSMKPDGSKNNSAGNIGGVIGKPVARYVSWWRSLMPLFSMEMQARIQPEHQLWTTYMSNISAYSI